MILKVLTRSGKNPCSFLWSDVAGLFCKEFHALASGFVLSSADGRAMAKQSRSPMVSPYHQAETPAPPYFRIFLKSTGSLGEAVEGGYWSLWTLPRSGIASRIAWKACLK